MNARPPMSVFKTATIMLPSLINTALKMGIDIQDILRRLGIAIDLEHIAHSTIDLMQINAIVMEIEKITGHPAIPLLHGENFDYEYMPHFKTFVMSAATLREAFESIALSQKLIAPLLILKPEETGKVITIKFKPDIVLSEEDDRRYSEMVFSCIKTQTNRLMRKTVPPRAVHFRHGRSEITPWYTDFFGCRIVLNAPENAIIYDRTIRSIPLPGGFPEIRRQSENILNKQIVDSPVYGGLVDHLKNLLATHDKLFNAPIDQVAWALNMSTRTMQRRLSENGCNFAEVRDQIRFELAAAALKSRRFSIEEISDKIGFSDRRSFSRAFKRQFGLTPNAYRRTLSP